VTHPYPTRRRESEWIAWEKTPLISYTPDLVTRLDLGTGKARYNLGGKLGIVYKMNKSVMRT